MKYNRNTISNLLVNRTFLNVVFIVTLLNLIGLLAYGNIHAIIFFILICKLFLVRFIKFSQAKQTELLRTGMVEKTYLHVAKNPIRYRFKYSIN